ncbi:MAG: NAD-binding protein [Spirochaetaceae bacterium]|nr:NAD-binding protein [Spirochaetaceae bacterium]
MRIIIIGAGFTGVQLAKRLISEKNNVAIIENDGELVRRVSNRLDCMVVNADGNSLQALEDAGIAKADALVALTESDEVNMITCSLADAVYPKCLKIARVRNYGYYVNTRNIRTVHAEAFSGDRRPLYGIDHMVHPDVEAAEAVCRAVQHGAVTDVLAFHDAEYVLTRITVEAKSRLDGARVLDLRQISDRQCLVAYIESQDKAGLPSGATVIHAGDVLGMLTLPDSIPHFLGLCGSRAEAINKIALVGAGRIGTIIAERLVQHRGGVFSRLFKTRFFRQQFAIIDNDEAMAKAASERFPSASVFRADVTDEAFLDEEGIASYDLVICVTHNHELNMVVAGYLKSLGVRKTIALVASAEFAEISRKIGSDVAIPLKDAVVDTILSHLRGKSVTGIHTVSSGGLEIIEFEVPEHAPVCGKTVKEIAVPGAFVLLLIQKQGAAAETPAEGAHSGVAAAYAIPVGDTAIDAGDRLILGVNTDNAAKVLALLGGKT